MLSHSFFYDTPAWLLVLLLAVCMALSIGAGNYIARKRYRGKEQKLEKSTVLFSAFFGLLGFMLAFTYSMSEARYDRRRTIRIEEANEINTTLMRCDLYPDSVRQLLRKNMYHYLQARIAYLNAGRSDLKINNALGQTEVYKTQLWKTAAAYSNTYPEQVATSNLMIESMNNMFSIVTRQNHALQSTVPVPVTVMLFALCIITGFFTGFSFSPQKPSWILTLGFVTTISLVIYITLDLDRPRRGLITMKTINKFVEDINDSFTEEEVELFKANR
jgi:uncharacterized protein YneF (UPF0154 family)